MKFFRYRLPLVAVFTAAAALLTYFTLFKKGSEQWLPRITHPLDNIDTKSPTPGLSGQRVSEVPTIVNNVSALIPVAQSIQQKHGVVLFCMINDAYFHFAASWCCNTAPLHVHERVLFLTTDVATGQRLKSTWPKVSVVAMDTKQFSGFRNYSKVGHVRMMTERTRFILRLLEKGIRVLLFEVDCLWLRDPLPLVLEAQSQGDILGTKVAGTDITAAGFLLLNPTPRTLQFWGQLTRDLDKLVASLTASRNTAGVSEAKNEQQYFTNLARRKFAGIQIAYLSEEVFPDGKWYSWPATRRQLSRPAIINNNWVVGSQSKQQRAKAFGHWFWDEPNKRCNATALLFIMRAALVLILLMASLAVEASNIAETGGVAKRTTCVDDCHQKNPLFPLEFCHFMCYGLQEIR